MALFDVTRDARDGNARALAFDTAHGAVHTPMFMPGRHACHGQRRRDRRRAARLG